MSIYSIRAQRRKEKNYYRLLLIITVSLLVFIYHDWSSQSKLLKSLTFQPHVITSGETLWKLAEESGLNIDTRALVHETLSYNSLTNTTIRPGQVIYIPVAGSKFAHK